MPTVNKEIADKIVACKGIYEDDPPVISIIEYDNQWGGTSYGLNYSSRNAYVPSPFVINPRLYFQYEY